MSHAQQLEQLRMVIHVAFQKLEFSSIECLQETILIRDGRYCGRRFRGELYQAIWDAEEDDIKYFGPEGDEVSLSELAAQPAPRPVSRAA